MRHTRFRRYSAAILLALSSRLPAQQPLTAEQKAYKKYVTTLASDAFEGRGPTTAGRIKARDYIARHFRALGLPGAVRKPGGHAETQDLPEPLKPYLQPFTTVTSVNIVDAKFTIATNTDKQDLALGKDYVVMAGVPARRLAGEAVFLGYAARNQQKKYSSFVGLKGRASLKGKVAVAFRYEPINAKGASAWTADGAWSPSAYLTSKARQAALRGAVALVIVNPPSHAQAPMLSRPTAMRRGIPIPMFQISTGAFRRLLQAAGQPATAAAVKALQATANAGSTRPRHLGVKLLLNAAVNPVRTPQQNVVALLPGAGDAAKEYIILGAHYDHLGFRETAKGRILFPGADDNASGTAGVMLTAARYAKRREARALPANRRSVIFAAFDVEEIGLRGSAYMAGHLAELGIAPKQVTAMINFDMIGRSDNNGAAVMFVGTAREWPAIITAAAKGVDLKLSKTTRGSGASDHASFYAQKIPSLFFAANYHRDAHSPRDTADKINPVEAVDIIDIADKVIQQLLQPAISLTFTPLPQPKRGGAFLGVTAAFQVEDDGLPIRQVAPRSPAAKAGLKPGDKIVALANTEVKSMQALLAVLQQYKAGDTVQAVVQRDSRRLQVDITLGKRR